MDGYRSKNESTKREKCNTNIIYGGIGQQRRYNTKGKNENQEWGLKD